MNRHEEMRQQVIEFHKRHPEVWEMFVQFTFQINLRLAHLEGMVRTIAQLRKERIV